MKVLMLSIKKFRQKCCKYNELDISPSAPLSPMATKDGTNSDRDPLSRYGHSVFPIFSSFLCDRSHPTSLLDMLEKTHTIQHQVVLVVVCRKQLVALSLIEVYFSLDWLSKSYI